MSQKLYISFIFCLLLIGIHNTLFAQRWQWGKVGMLKDTNLNTMVATDPAGNLYVASNRSGIDVEGHLRPGYGAQNACLVSFDCEGKYRWGKIIGNKTLVGNLKTDEAGGVYISGRIFTGDSVVHIDVDALITTTQKEVIFIKYDTAGNYQWNFMPEPDTGILASYQFTTCNMEVAANGAVSVLAMVLPGNFCSGKYIVTDTNFSLHAFNISTAGKFLNATPIDILAGPAYLNSLRMARDFSRDQYYIYSRFFGSDSAYYGSERIDKYSMPFGKFNDKGKLLWLKHAEGDTRLSNTINNILYDNDGSIYVACNANPGSVLDGYTFTNSLGTNSSYSIIKYDASAVQKWVCNSSTLSNVSGFALALSNTKLGAAGGWLSSAIKWNGTEWCTSYKKTTPVGSGDIFTTGAYFLTINKTTGKIETYDSLMGYRLLPNSLAGNSKDNFYLSGSYGNYARKDLTLPGVDTLICAGDVYDNIPFILRYGTANCATSGIITILQDKSLKVYPNPAQEFIVIENAEINSIVSVYNTLGQLLLKEQIVQAKQSINIGGLSTGMFVVEVLYPDNNRTYSKLIKR